jgi:hypothetical protein
MTKPVDEQIETCFRALWTYHRSLEVLKPGMARGYVRLILVRTPWEPARRRLAAIVAKHPKDSADPPPTLPTPA